MTTRRHGHWEWVALGHAIVLGGWLLHPNWAWALAAGAAAIAATLLSLRTRRAGPVVVSLLAIVGAGIALFTTRNVSEVEHNWGPDSTGVRWQLVRKAGARLDAVLSDAVQETIRLAERAEEIAGAERSEAFTRLAQETGRVDAEQGVVILDPDLRPWAWAGRHRLAPATPIAGLDARITPFYATLDVWRQAPNGFAVVAHVVLAADQAVPDRERTVRSRFARAAGVDLEFYPAGRGPFWADVYDYCLPSCVTTGAVPDTLFSVRLVPPTQGEHKLEILARGGRLVAVFSMLLLLGLTPFGGRPTRAAALAVFGGLLVLTPAGSELRLGTLFSPSTFFAETLGPLSGTAGALLVTAMLALIAVVAVTRRGAPRGVPGVVTAAVLIVSAPHLLRVLSAGITPPSEGSGVGLWLQWELPITVASATLLLLAAAFVRGRGDDPAPIWMPVLGVAWAIGAAVLGLMLWQPITGWPPWYLSLWLPAIILAIQPAPRLRAVATLAVVSGTAAALLTWGAAADGRLLLAERDMVGLRQGGDPVAVGLLERFGRRLQEESVPRNSAELFSRWSRSTLYEDRYPALLMTWTRDGDLLARLDLADLALGDDVGIVRRLAINAADAHIPTVQPAERVPGTHYVLSVPFPDGAIVSAVIGPRTRAIPPVAVAQFLRGARALPPPYTLTISEPILGTPIEGLGAPSWSRDGQTVRGEARLDLADGARHLHATLDLGSITGLLIRGVLVGALDIALIAALWLFAEALLGGVRLPPIVLELLTRRSYRARLGIAFAVFFVIPTVGFAAWTAQRMRGEAQRSRDLVIHETLADATAPVKEFPGMPALLARDFLIDLGSRLNADLVFYEGGELVHASSPVLAELGVLDRFLAPPVFTALTAADQLEISFDGEVAGRPTRVGFRDLGGFEGRGGVLAAPRLVEDPDRVRSEQDLLFGLLLVTLGGLVTAAVLATVVARTLTRPVRALSEAAELVGRGGVPTPFAGDTPGEFEPVMEAFGRMANDVNASRQELEEQRQRTAAVLRNVVTGVVALDDHLCVTMANPTAEELLGCRLDPGRSVFEATPATWMPVWEWVRAAAKGLKDSDPTEFTIGEHQVRVQIGRLRGAATGWVVALDDVTDLARAVRVLAWGELARQIAHEIKNPLTPIRLGIQHLRRSYDAPRGDFAGTLDQTSRQMLAEIERLDAIARAFSRFGAPPADGEPLEDVNLVEVARDTAALYTMGDGDAVRVEAGGPVTGTVRRDELKEVLINLIENARTAGAQRVTIALSTLNGRATIALRDDGQGIPARDLARIFEPQFSTTTSGTGLGLAICKRLVESWGGEIAVASDAGRGTTVTIRVG